MSEDKEKGRGKKKPVFRKMIIKEEDYNKKIKYYEYTKSKGVNGRENRL